MVLTDSPPVQLKWPAADFSLPGTDGNQYSLKDFQGKKGLLITFTCNHCPYAKAAWPLLIELNQKYADHIQLVTISANDAETYPADSFDSMKQFAQSQNLPFPYLYDEDQSVAKAYDAVCTPDNYLFKFKDDQFLLYYRGRINDNWQQPDQVTQHNLADAIDQLLQDNPPPSDQPASMGCSIKWKQ